MTKLPAKPKRPRPTRYDPLDMPNDTSPGAIDLGEPLARHETEILRRATAQVTNELARLKRENCALREQLRWRDARVEIYRTLAHRLPAMAGPLTLSQQCEACALIGMGNHTNG